MTRLSSTSAARKPQIQESLLLEALELLEDTDRRAIAAHPPGGPYEGLAGAMGISLEAAGPRYAAAVNRLQERLVWVGARERLGVSPPERWALGRARFFGTSAQETARQLRLPVEAVERWIQRAALPFRLEE